MGPGKLFSTDLHNKQHPFLSIKSINVLFVLGHISPNVDFKARI